MFRRSAAVVVALAVTLGATACQPEPTPTPTGPAFASEDEAFAAAEETYRAYVDALNQVDLSDPDTFEAVYAWTTGEANAEAKKTFTTMHADMWTVSGKSVPTIVEPRLWGGSGNVEVAVCLNVADVSLVNNLGESVVDPDRPDVQSMLVTMEQSPTESGWAIRSFDGRDGEPSCG